MASGSVADVGLRLRLFGRSEVRAGMRDAQTDTEELADQVRNLADRAADGAKGLAGLVDSKITKGLRGLGSAAKSAGVGIAKGLAIGVAAAGAAVGAALTAAVVKGIESEGVQRTLQVALGMTPAQAAEAGAIAGRIYAQNYGESRDQVAQALATLSTSTGLDVTSAQLQDATKYALDLASAFDVEVSESARAAGQLVRAGLVENLQAAYDLISVGFQKGANRGEDFLDTLDQYNTTFTALGVSGQQAVGLIVQAMNAGVYASDNAADALRETGTIITAGGEAVDTALQSIGLNAGEIEKGFNDGGTAAVNALDKVFDALRHTDDATLRSAAATALIGTQYEDLGDAILAMDPSTAVAALGKVDGAAARLDASLAQGVTPAFETVKRSVEGLVYGAGAALAQKWGPDVEDVLNRVSSGVNTLAGDLPGLGSDLMAALSTGDLTGLGGRLEAAFALPAGSISGLTQKTTALVTEIREEVLPVVAAIVAALTQWAEHKITHTLPIVTAVVGFLAQHTDALTKVVYLGLIGWGLYRTILTAVAINTARVTITTKAQTIAQNLQNRAVLISRSYLATWIGVKALELAAWVRSTAATAASTIALGANRAAAGVGYLATFVAVKGLEFAAWVRSTAATAAGTAALLAAAAAGLVVRGATVAATAAQWLWNAALTANPIGLVVAAIALLVGGLVWFFTKTEVGRAAWEKLSGAFHTAVDWITGTAVPAIKNGFASAIDTARAKFDKIRDAVKGFVDKVKDALTWVAKLADKLTGGLVGKALSVVGVNLDGAAANGGAIRSGETFLVGERGPELFTASRSGLILPNEALASTGSPSVPTAAVGAVPQVTIDDADSDVTDGLVTLSLEVPLIVDGREIARATVSGMHTAAAWK